MQQRNLLYIAISAALVILAGYVYVYQVSPLATNWNDILIAATDPFVSLLAGISVTAVLLCYQRDDKPYVIWLFFTVGIWFWVFAETLYAYIEFSSGEVPPTGWSDLFWFIGYGLLAVAIYLQYQLVANTKIAFWKPIAISFGVILSTACVLFLLNIPLSMESFVGYLYPVVDFAICIVAFILYRAFGGGKLSRPWIGLFVMGVADAIWAWQAAGGGDQADIVSLVSDTTYVLSYLILAIGFLRQYLLLRLGPE